MSNLEMARPRGRFDVALMAGLFWGVAGVFTVSSVGSAYLGIVQGAPPEQLLMLPLAAGRVALFAAFFGILPAGLFGGVIGWCVYRLRIVSRWAYLAVGALAAFLGVASWDLLLAATRGDSPVLIAGADDPSLYALFYLPFVLIGAFGGYMGGRVLQRA